MFKKMLVALDGSASAQSAFALALSLAKAESAKLVVCTVVDPMDVASENAPLPPTEAALARARALAERMLSEASEHAREASVDVETKVLSGEPAHEIDRYARSVSADAIVMGTHGRSGIKRLLMGSVAEAVLRSARCPVIVVHQAS